MKACWKKYCCLLLVITDKKKPNFTHMKQEFKYLREAYETTGPYFVYKNLLVRSFIYSKINTFGLPKLSRISFAFNIFLPISLCKKCFN